MDLLEFRADRLPGIPRGFAFEARPGVNLLTGPNGSGKSSMARALAYLLWPAQEPSEPGREVRARFLVQGRELTATTTTGGVVWTQAGKPVPPPTLPPDHLAACYHVDILDVLPPSMAQGDEELARLLATELAGGLDPARLKESLFSLAGLAAGRRRKDLENARIEAGRIRKYQESLAQRQLELETLKQQLAKAERANRRLLILEAVVTHREKTAQLEDCRRKLAALPAGLRDIRDEDPERLRGLREDMAAKYRRKSELERRLETDRRTMKTTPPLPDRGIPAVQAELESRLDVLQTTEVQRTEAHAALDRLAASSARDVESDAGEAAGGTEAAGRLEPAVLNRIMDTWGRYLDSLVRVRALSEVRADRARLAGPTSWAGILTGGGVLLVAALLTWLKRHDAVLALGMAGGGVIMALLTWWRSTHRPAETGSSSAARLRDEQSRCDQARIGLQRLMDEAGLDLNLDDPSGPLLLERLRTRLERQDQQDRARDAATAADNQWSRARTAFNALLAELHQQEIDDVATARAALARLRQTWSDTQDLQERIRSAEQNLRELDDSCRRLEQEIDGLLGPFALDPRTATDRDLQRLLAAKPEYLRLENDVNALTKDLQELEGILAEAPQYFPDEQLEVLASDELARRIQAEKDLAAASGSINREIGSLEQEIRTAGKGHDLEQALARAASARDRLAAARRLEVETRLGIMLLDDITTEYQAATRPAALAQADENLRAITGQAYRLLCDQGGEDGPLFTVHDEESGHDLSCAQLSTGTRTQLFLAVRMGFLAAQTGGDHPPLVLDDVLTASDPERFTAAVAGLGRLAEKQGLQLFYLCSRPDEVAAWNQTLQEHGLPAAHVIDLAAIRTLGEAASPAVLAGWNPDQQDKYLPPDPAGMTPARYARELGVPRPRTWDAPGNLHLFYLLADDLPLLHRLLLAGVGTVGHWHTDGARLTEAGIITGPESRNLNDRVTVWERFLVLWRRGRPPRVTREVLENSPVRKSTKFDEIMECLAEVHGKGADLVAALKNKRVSGLRQSSIAQLEDYLLDHDYLDPGSPMSPDEILRNLFIDSQSWLRSGSLEKQTIHLLVDRLAETLDA